MLRNSLLFTVILICAFNSNAATANVDRCKAMVDKFLQNKANTIDDDIVTNFRSFGYDAVDAIADRIDIETKSQNPNHKLYRAFGMAIQKTDSELEADQNIQKLEDLLDAVSKQRHGCASRILWHTDMQEALGVAKASGKPVLSLRMLGNLTDEFSCANSRFFRTTLYSNESISKLLRANFVLHWQSVRPVPKVTIDFGDGRVLNRTITGNSAHYLLTADGRTIDCLPGLYGAEPFKQWLVSGSDFARRIAAAPKSKQQELVQRHHRERIESLNTQLTSHMSVVDPEFINDRSVETFESFMTDALWQKLASRHSNWGRLDKASKNLISTENPIANKAAPTAGEAVPLAVTKAFVETPMVRMLRHLENNIGIDSVRNEYVLHRRIHHWFAISQKPLELEQLNERVYAKLFLTPSSDPWLGLKPAGVYSGLENDGVAISNRK